MVLEAVASVFGDIHVESFTEENYDSDDESDDDTDNWVEIFNDPSFLTLLYQSEWNVDSFSIGDNDTGESIDSSSNLPILYCVISNIGNTS
jgi:hypothetical protein